MKSIILALVLFALPGAALAICETTSDGPVATVHSAVKKPGDPVTLTWVNPTEDGCGDPLTADLALTFINLYVEVDGPVTATTPVAAVLAPDQTSLGMTADANKGADIYYALKACSDFGCSMLSNQPYIKLPGNPKKSENLLAN